MAIVPERLVAGLAATAECDSYAFKQAVEVVCRGINSIEALPAFATLVC